MMVNRAKHFFILILLIGSISASAQMSVSNLFSNNMDRGEAMFDDLYYDQAITYYKMALKRDNLNKDIKLKIAQSYRLLGDYESSLYWYEQAFTDDYEPRDSIHNLYYGDDLVTAEMYDEAYDYYRSFWGKAPTDSRSMRKLEALDQLDWLFEDSTTLTLNNLSFNTEYNDLSAIQFNDGLVFLSSRPAASLVDQDFLREENLLDLFYTSYDSLEGWTEAKRLAKGLNSNYYEGQVSFVGESEVILTRSNTALGKPITNSDGRTELQLYDATKIGDAWVVGGKLSFCNSEYSYAHPALNATGDTLYFASNMDGGFGGNDIYMSVKENNDWTEPVNLGYILNTEGEESNPFFVDDRLFFSSDGQGGLGGLDIQKAFMRDGRIVEVVNAGFPINSAYDDFAYTIDKKTLKGNITSNRKGGKGKDDVYGFETLARILAGIVQQEQDGSRIEDALVKLTSNGEEIGSVFTDSLGQFRFQLPIGQEFEVEVTKEDHRASVPLYIPNSLNRIDLDTLMIMLHRDDLFAKGRIIDNETQRLMEGVRVVLHNATDNVFDTLITNSEGIYTFVLDTDKSFNIWASKAGYIFGGADINTLEIDSGVIVNDIVLELAYEKKSAVHFEFNKYDLTSETRAILRRTAVAMRHTTHQLIISAYADARGTIEYNQRLSDKRAAEVLNYFISQGVDKSRIIARGFGEALILNRCMDGVHCEEIEHSKNRRAEIKIEGSTVN